MIIDVKTDDGPRTIVVIGEQTEDKALIAHGFDPDSADYTVVQS